MSFASPLATPPTFGWYFTVVDAGFSTYSTSTVCGISFKVTVWSPFAFGTYTLPSCPLISDSGV